jgi:hypothetical protein
MLDSPAEVMVSSRGHQMTMGKVLACYLDGRWDRGRLGRREGYAQGGG